MAAKPLIRSRFPAAKTAFGEAFGAATGVGAPSYSGGFADWTDFSRSDFARRSRMA
jgi:hypothetical protein